MHDCMSAASRAVVLFLSLPLHLPNYEGRQAGRPLHLYAPLRPHTSTALLLADTLTDWLSHHRCACLAGWLRLIAMGLILREPRCSFPLFVCIKGGADD